MNWKKPALTDDERISNVTRSVKADTVLAQYVPKPRQSLEAAPHGYADVLEQVRSLSVKAVDTYGNRVIDDVQTIVQAHLEVSLKLAARAQEISDHYHSEMSALRKDTNDFTLNARRDLEKLAGLVPSANAPNVTEAVRHLMDEHLNGSENEDATK